MHPDWKEARRTGGFPDCEAKRQIARGKWQRVRIEFEYESRAFRDHGHRIDGCDIIVCWKNDLPQTPGPQILALKDEMKKVEVEMVKQGFEFDCVFTSFNPDLDRALQQEAEEESYGLCGSGELVVGVGRHRLKIRPPDVAFCPPCLCKMPNL